MIILSGDKMKEFLSFMIFGAIMGIIAMTIAVVVLALGFHGYIGFILWFIIWATVIYKLTNRQ